MDFTEHPHQHALAIREVSTGKIRINDEAYQHSVLLTADFKLLPWEVSCVDDLNAALLEPLLASKPEVVIIGTGAEQVFLDPALLQVFYQAGTGVEVMSTAAAARTYNILAAEERITAAGLILP